MKESQSYTSTYISSHSGAGCVVIQNWLRGEGSAGNGNGWHHIWSISRRSASKGQVGEVPEIPTVGQKHSASHAAILYTSMCLSDPREGVWGWLTVFLPRRVEVWPEEGQSLGLSIVGGRHVIKRLRNGEELKGIFIKQVLANSPAAKTQCLKTGDKILEVGWV